MTAVAAVLAVEEEEEAVEEEEEEEAVEEVECMQGSVSVTTATPLENIYEDTFTTEVWLSQNQTLFFWLRAW